MHLQRKTAPSTDLKAASVKRPSGILELRRKAPNRFAAAVNASKVADRPEIAAYQRGYRDATERNRAVMHELAEALELAMAVGWPDDVDPRNAEWRRLIWRVRRTPK